LPREIGRLQSLQELALNDNRLRVVPAELGRLRALKSLWLHGNLLQWLPVELECSPAEIRASNNPLRLTFSAFENVQPRLQELFAATTHIGMIRERATEICIALQDLELPAFVTLQIIDEAVHENSIRMWAKWELITAVKHFRDR
jgi:Leucine-rich repeat (LRR) protein